MTTMQNPPTEQSVTAGLSSPAGGQAGAMPADSSRVSMDGRPRERVLAIPPPPVRIEPAVRAAREALEVTYASEVVKAERTIAKYGLTIEAVRLRDRLARSAGSDLERLLLSTPGVTEMLFNKAVAAQLDEEKQLGSPVQDLSVQSIGARIEAASKTLERSLSAINRTNRQFQESTKAIVGTLEKVVDALQDDDSGDYDAKSPSASSTSTSGSKEETS
jgi:hypothetical protein